MNALPEPIRGNSPDPNLEEQDRRLQSWLDRYELIAGPAFRGRKDPIRFWLEIKLLACWISLLEGDLSFSRKLDGTPFGPLVEFLTLTLQAILGAAPGPDKSSISTEKPHAYRINLSIPFNSPTVARRSCPPRCSK